MYTLHQAKEDCIKMWDWLRKNPDKGKDDYFGIKMWEDYPILNGCAMCVYTKEVSKNDSCRMCPAWPGDGPRCHNDNTSYKGWAEAGEYLIDELYVFSTKDQLISRKRRCATEVLKRALKIKV